MSSPLTMEGTLSEYTAKEAFIHAIRVLSKDADEDDCK